MKVPACGSAAASAGRGDHLSLGPSLGVLPRRPSGVNRMEKRRLGRTDLHVSAICLGTMTWGQQNTEAEGHEQMDLAFDRGVNFLDTAEAYSIPPKPETQGSTERFIGNWMKARKNRDQVILATKVVGRTANGWFRGDRP